MNKKVISAAVAIALGSITLTACQHTPKAVEAVQQVSAEQQAQLFSTQFIEALWQLSPTWALYSGYHKYDDQLVIPNDLSRQKTLAFVAAQRKLLSKIDQSKLSDSSRIDLTLIENLLDSSEWEVSTFKSWQWQPSQYNVAGGFAQVINGDYAPLEQRLSSVLTRLTSVDDYYKAARENISNPTLEHTKLAVMQNQGALGVFSDDLIEQAQQSQLSHEQKAQFKERVLAARTTITKHIDWLEKLQADLEENGARDFRIGSELYQQKFALDIQSNLTAKQLYNKAVDDKQRVLAEMETLAHKLWPTYFPNQAKPQNRQQLISQLIEKLSVKHVKREDFVSDIRQQIPELEAFVNDKNLITLDKEKPLVVRETPSYMRGFAGASISAPGPYDKKANTYYNVTPLDNMTEEQAESYLREYNHWVLQVLNIHEAVPGHYTQLVYANMSPSLVKSLFGNGAMIEGWAVYSERMMLEEGYGDFEPELWLMYYKWNLRVITNTILDYEIHNKNISKEQGLSLMMDGAFQQQAEAEGKWNRATLSQVQLTSYYSGYRDIYDLRTDYKAKQGKDYSVKAFHDEFLSYGSSPVKYIRELMLNK
ncbi:DUF885 domain-containing protein [Psychrobium sp. 1_MG-2023]|uniref:DUF885 domain-containing protein n=1 Tax=Psychrobium sp. 1_MG-2023 TaxID=3062624 RepID=UPI000C3359FF|nr:DUF885 domain-containing protein [Psychrobium sp. 1_MG-2023]MDP2560069.1 DUF885 domain-containing protein [Psychrobium sp. 1_MG-2023]PKF56270.1 DUF885 domain-containing protein [Alteromonadales bacterium alter-6D02]